MLYVVENNYEQNQRTASHLITNTSTTQVHTSDPQNRARQQQNRQTDNGVVCCAATPLAAGADAHVFHAPSSHKLFYK